jgi:hypothetical protein
VLGVLARHTYGSDALSVQVMAISCHTPRATAWTACRGVLGVGRRVLGVGCWVLGVGCWVLGVGRRVLGVGCWVLGVGCWVLGVGKCKMVLWSLPDTHLHTSSELFNRIYFV